MQQNLKRGLTASKIQIEIQLVLHFYKAFLSSYATGPPGQLVHNWLYLIYSWQQPKKNKQKTNKLRNTNKSVQTWKPWHALLQIKACPWCHFEISASDECCFSVVVQIPANQNSLMSNNIIHCQSIWRFKVLPQQLIFQTFIRR